jgi:NADPH:quinone reductase-like Zn-dependent oxidoreductase
MKVPIAEKYGPPETLQMTGVDTPAPDADEVPVNVLRASAYAADH